MSKVGRPSKFSEAVASEICERIADGESLRRICKDDHMPCLATVRTWLRAGVEAQDKTEPHAIFLSQYARAREDQADSYADKITDLAEYAVSADDRTQVEGVKVAIDALKWAAGKRKPKVYGDKIQNELSGEVRVIEQKMVLEEPPPGWKAGPDGG